MWFNKHRSAQSLWTSFHLCFQTYAVRVELAVVVTLLLLLGVAHLPLSSATPAVGWRFSEAPSAYRFDLIDLPDKDEGASAASQPGAPITRHLHPSDSSSEDKDGGARMIVDTQSDSKQDLARLEAQSKVLEFSEEMPQIQGGIGAYYINIQYPKAAIEAGVHGRLILSFVVERDGIPTDIEVLQPLHPLCDSSAVRALRKTRFVPGRQNGNAVRVRMRLPVHFKIVEPPTDQRAEIDTPDARG